jgi:hypothetical protein
MCTWYSEKTTLTTSPHAHVSIEVWRLGLETGKNSEFVGEVIFNVNDIGTGKILN